jgi:hypothetical protein
VLASPLSIHLNVDRNDTLAGFLNSSSKSDADMTIGLDQFVAINSDANMKDSLIAFFLSAITIAAPYLVYLNLQSSDMNRTFMLFETKFGSMLVFRQVQPLSVVNRMKMSGKG